MPPGRVAAPANSTPPARPGGSEVLQGAPPEVLRRPPSTERGGGRPPGANGSPAARSFEAAFDKVSVEDSVMKAIAAAEAAVGERDAEWAAREQIAKTLPLFRPGQAYTAEQAKGGFRVPDGYAVSKSNFGAVRVGRNRRPDHEDATGVFFPSCNDEGLEWVYWDDFFKNGDGQNLQECVAAYGIGGWHYPEKDMRVKVVFLDKHKSRAPSRCFILAVDRPAEGVQLGVRGQEKRDSTRRVYRSTDVDEAKQLNALWAAVQFRKGVKEIDSFWSMPAVAARPAAAHNDQLPK